LGQNFALLDKIAPQTGSYRVKDFSENPGLSIFIAEKRVGNVKIFEIIDRRRPKTDVAFQTLADIPLMVNDSFPQVSRFRFRKILIQIFPEGKLFR
jgi:hypothetical protein